MSRLPSKPRPGSFKAYRAYVLPYWIDEHDEIQILVGVKKERPNNIMIELGAGRVKHPYSYSFLGGRCDNWKTKQFPFADPNQCAAKELCEETTGLSYYENDFLPVVEFDKQTANPRFSEKIAVYILPVSDLSQIIQTINQTRTNENLKHTCLEYNFLDIVSFTELKQLPKVDSSTGYVYEYDSTNRPKNWSPLYEEYLQDNNKFLALWDHHHDILNNKIQEAKFRQHYKNEFRDSIRYEISQTCCQPGLNNSA